MISPSSEADPIALLIQTVISFGSIIGRSAFFIAENDKHYANEFAVLAGETAKGRKGSSASQSRAVPALVDEIWAAEKNVTGLSSGEGLIFQVRDPVFKREAVKERGRITGYQEVETDPGVDDKRLYVLESEYANVLKVAERQGNTLSPIIRQAWETGTLRTLTKNSPTKATGAHISIVGHVTIDELRRYLSATEMASGFANRFIWLCVRRSKCLPEGGRVDPALIGQLAQRFGAAVDFAKQVGEMKRNAQARKIWAEVYPSLSEGKPGLVGAMLGRSEAHVMRLSMIHALMDCSSEIQPAHLYAALALWDYSEASVKFIFGDSLGDPVADDLLRAIRNQGKMTRTEMSHYFGRHQSSSRIGQALGNLMAAGLIERESVQSNGRPREVWMPKGRGT